MTPPTPERVIEVREQLRAGIDQHNRWCDPRFTDAINTLTELADWLRLGEKPADVSYNADELEYNAKLLEYMAGRLEKECSAWAESPGKDAYMYDARRLRKLAVRERSSPTPSAQPVGPCSATKQCDLPNYQCLAPHCAYVIAKNPASSPTPSAQAKCETCDGRGTYQWSANDCPACNGTGSAPPSAQATPDDIAHLLRFYNVATIEEVVRMQSLHIQRLQSKLPPARDGQPRNYREG